MTVIAFRKIAQSSSMFQLIDYYPFGLKIQIYNIIFLLFYFNKYQLTFFILPAATTSASFS